MYANTSHAANGTRTSMQGSVTWRRPSRPGWPSCVSGLPVPSPHPPSARAGRARISHAPRPPQATRRATACRGPMAVAGCRDASREPPSPRLMLGLSILLLWIRLYPRPLETASGKKKLVDTEPAPSDNTTLLLPSLALPPASRPPPPPGPFPIVTTETAAVIRPSRSHDSSALAHMSSVIRP